MNSHHPAKRGDDSPIKDDSEVLRSQRNNYLNIIDQRRKYPNTPFSDHGAPDNIGEVELSQQQ